LRFAVASLAVIYVWLTVGLSARKVMQAREWLIDRGQGTLASSHKAASLDVGWLGAAFPGDILDLAGVTDARVALLPGGHTTKKIPNSWFDSEQPDTLVLLTANGEIPREPWKSLRFARGIENRIRHLPYFENCWLADTLNLMNTTQTYVVVRCPKAP
jgi:hypothetical protein